MCTQSEWPTYAPAQARHDAAYAKLAHTNKNAYAVRVAEGVPARLFHIGGNAMRMPTDMTYTQSEFPKSLLTGGHGNTACLA